MIYHTPYIVRKILPQFTWRYVHADRIYLTFDDGPVPEATPFVLDTLKQFGAKATFFCVGENVVKYPEIYNRIIAEGHTIGNHTYNHLNGWHTDTDSYIDNVAKAAEVINSKLYRPPYGKLKPTQYKRLKENYEVVMWDILSGDYNPKMSVAECQKIVFDNAKPGSIIVFHDSIKAIDKLKQLLPVVLAHFSENGWVMDALKDKSDEVVA